MSGLFSFFSFAAHVMLVIGGLSAVVLLFSGRKPRASNREIKIVLAVVFALLIVMMIGFTLLINHGKHA